MTFESQLRTIPWEELDSILLRCPYMGQRKLSEARLAGLQAIYDAGQWHPFAISRHHLLSAPEQEYLTNGQHRLTLVIRNRANLPFIDERHGVDTMEEIKRAYDGYDTPEAARSFTDLVPSSGLLDRTDIGVTRLHYVKGAVALIGAAWEPQRLRVLQLASRSNVLRFQLLAEWLGEASQFYAAIRPTPRSAEKFFRFRSWLSVGLVTFRYQPERAAQFWGRVSQNSGLCRADPEWELLQRFAQNSFVGKGNSCHEARLVAAAWNAFFDQRSLSVLKSFPECPIAIRGTPFKG